MHGATRSLLPDPRPVPFFGVGLATIDYSTIAFCEARWVNRLTDARYSRLCCTPHLPAPWSRLLGVVRVVSMSFGTAVLTHSRGWGRTGGVQMSLRSSRLSFEFVALIPHKERPFGLSERTRETVSGRETFDQGESSRESKLLVTQEHTAVRIAPPTPFTPGSSSGFRTALGSLFRYL